MLSKHLIRLLAITTVFAIPATNLYAELEEITVTARKRVESLQEIPISVSALSQNDINERGITDTESLSQFTPGFELQNLGQGGTSGRENPGIRFRGVSVQQSSPSARAGAIFWNGAYVSDGIGVLPLIDLERAEVIKGPQNAVFGRNTFAGAVNYYPAKPGDELNGRLTLSYSPGETDDNNLSITGAIGGPLTDNISGRIALTDSRKAGYYEYLDGSPLGSEETTAFMGSLVFDVTDNVSVTYSGFFVDSEDSRALVGQDGPFGPGDCNRTYSGSYRDVVTGATTGTFSTDLSQNVGNIFCGSVPAWDDVPPNTPPVSNPDASTPDSLFGGGWDYVNTAPAELAGAGIKSPGKLGNAYEVTRHHLSANVDLANDFNVSGFYSIGNSQHWGITDTLYGQPGQLPRWSGFIKEVEDTSAEIRLTSPSDQRLRYSIGLSHYEQDSVTGDFPQFAGFANRFLGLGAFGVPIDPPNIQNIEGSNNGVFGSIDFDISDDWILSLEGRYNKDESDIIFEGQSGTAGNSATGRSQSYSAFMPRVILSWQPTDNLNVYGSYSNSYLQGIPTRAEGYAAAVPTANLNPDTVGFFTPRQELNAFELGVKHALSDCFSYTASLYNMTWDNMTFFELSPSFVPLNLFGDSEYLGLDLEFNATVTDWFQLVGGFSWVDVELKEFAGAGSVANSVLAAGGIVSGTQIDSSGNRPRYVPDTTGSLSAAFDLGDFGTMPAALRLDMIHTGDFFIDNFEWNRVDSSLKFNARATLGLTDNVSLELYGLNLTDDRTWSTAGGTTGAGGPNRKTFAVPTRGSEYGMRIVADF